MKKRLKTCKKNSSREKCTEPSCDLWHPPVCLNYKSESGCKYGDCCQFRLNEVDSQQRKKSKTSGGTESVALNIFNSVVYPKIALRKSLFFGRLIESHRQVLQEHMAPRKKSGKEGLKNANLKSEFRALQNSRKDARRNPQTGAMRPQRSLGPGKGCL